MQLDIQRYFQFGCYSAWLVALGLFVVSLVTGLVAMLEVLTEECLLPEELLSLFHFRWWPLTSRETPKTGKADQGLTEDSPVPIALPEEPIMNKDNLLRMDGTVNQVVIYNSSQGREVVKEPFEGDIIDFIRNRRDLIEEVNDERPISGLIVLRFKEYLSQQGNHTYEEEEQRQQQPFYDQISIKRLFLEKELLE